jgi:hypothetical protein
MADAIPDFFTILSFWMLRPLGFAAIGKPANQENRLQKIAEIFALRPVLFFSKVAVAVAVRSQGLVSSWRIFQEGANCLEGGSLLATAVSREESLLRL